MSTIYYVGTPIGNLKDITFRAIEILEQVDLILAEDTRNTKKLLNRYNIQTKLISYHEHNKEKRLPAIIKALDNGDLALVSDAGTPTLSDPGLLLIKTCVEKKIKIFPIPGPSSITAAVSISGFDDKFLFYGFLPKTENDLIKALKPYRDLDFSLVFFVPGIKINFYLKIFKEYFSSRDILIAREITKIHETFYREKISAIEPFKNVLKGELTIVISKIYNNNE